MKIQHYLCTKARSEGVFYEYFIKCHTKSPHDQLSAVEITVKKLPPFVVGTAARNASRAKRFLIYYARDMRVFRPAKAVSVRPCIDRFIRLRLGEVARRRIPVSGFFAFFRLRTVLIPDNCGKEPKEKRLKYANSLRQTGENRKFFAYFFEKTCIQVKIML